MTYAVLTLVSFVSWFFPQAIPAATECAPVVIEIVSSVDAEYRGTEPVRAFYDVDSRTVFIDSDSTLENLFHELGHHHGVTCLDDWSEEYARSWDGQVTHYYVPSHLEGEITWPRSSLKLPR